jgi:hypothetical protein
MKNITASGMTAEAAFNNQLNFKLITDLTKQWHKSPENDILVFAKEFEVSLDLGEGYYIVLEAPKIVNPKRKVKLNNILNKETRKWKTKFVFVNEDTREILESQVKANTKGEAIKEAKRLALELKVSISIELTKVLTVGKDQLAVIEFADVKETPGKFYFFGIETDEVVSTVPADNEDDN